ncbi:MAG TPA: hypothetical protein PK926_13435 [Spirochaetota bacterium]|nr:hypothetical protein [Spirochaetota bacterium]HPI90301.1 hypothetical protein [Spirochaetota bacterium]HPR49309.1 hypothetical protein [Spirochaetota bacterium]
MKKIPGFISFAVILSLMCHFCTEDTDHSREGMIIDHTCTDLAAIPSKWLSRAKSLTVHYAHTSHGSQLITGANYLEDHIDSVLYAFESRESGTEGLPDEQDPPALRMYDGNPPETYIEPDDYWYGDDALARTGAVAGTGHYVVSLWSWCGQQSSNSIETVQEYLDSMEELEESYPSVRFVYMTGHTDGGTETLERNNDLVRDFCRKHKKILYDFADIESWAPDGTNYPDTTDACSWCTDWCLEHGDDCENIPVSDSECAHTHGFNCVLKGRAFWWMMARIAGWDGE